MRRLDYRAWPRRWRLRPAGSPRTAGEVTLLNVSYDPTRELYEEFNADFAATTRPRTARP